MSHESASVWGRRCVRCGGRVPPVGLPLCLPPTSLLRLGKVPPGPQSCQCGGRKEGSWGVLEKRFCALGWGFPLIFMILIYTVPAVEANASCIAVYIPNLGL